MFLMVSIVLIVAFFAICGGMVYYDWREKKAWQYCLTLPRYYKKHAAAKRLGNAVQPMRTVDCPIPEVSWTTQQQRKWIILATCTMISGVAVYCGVVYLLFRIEPGYRFPKQMVSQIALYVIALAGYQWVQRFRELPRELAGDVMRTRRDACERYCGEVLVDLGLRFICTTVKSRGKYSPPKQPRQLYMNESLSVLVEVGQVSPLKRFRLTTMLNDRRVIRTDQAGSVIVDENRIICSQVRVGEKLTILEAIDAHQTLLESMVQSGKVVPVTHTFDNYGDVLRYAEHIERSRKRFV